MGKYFGTDGVRGIFGEELTTELAYQLGKYGTYVLSAGSHQPVIVIGRDTRASGEALEEALVKGITAVGGKVLLAGVIPTPAVAVLARDLGADAGIVISASHNPYEFNGIKFFNGEGFKLADAVEDEIESHIDGQTEIAEKDGGVVETIETPEKFYLDHIAKDFATDLGDLKIVMDTANGAAYAIAPDFFRSMGAELIVIGDEPDGRNINLGCGSTHLDELAKQVVAEGADIGIAFDGDADRCLAVDCDGAIIDGDKLINIIGRELKNEGRLPADTVVVTVMSNIGLNEALDAAGISSEKTAVGDRYVLERMQEKGYTLGGEQSGHVIMLDHNTTGDGILTALAFLSILKKDGRTSAELANLMTVYPQVLVNAVVATENKETYMDDPIIAERIAAIEAHFKNQGRVLIRPSGTEPLVRVMIEGKDQAELESLATELAELIEERLG